MLPTGYGATIICRSNCPKLRCSMYEKPYQITLLFNGTLAKSCSGSNPQKTCSYFIHNTAEGNSGDYTCKTYNQYGCTMDTLRLVFKGKLTATLSYDPTVKLLQKCYRLKQLGRERAPLKPQKAYKKCEKKSSEECQSCILWKRPKGSKDFPLSALVDSNTSNIIKTTALIRNQSFWAAEDCGYLRVLRGNSQGGEGSVVVKWVLRENYRKVTVD